MTEPRVPLSAGGSERYERILRLALTEAGRRRRRHTLRVTLLVLIAMALVILPMRWPSHVPPQRIAVRHGVKRLATPHQAEAVIARRIETDPNIIARLAIRPRASEVIVIRDEQLLGELAAAHQPAGLAYVNGKAKLLFR